MTTKITLSDETEQSLTAVRRELPDSDSPEEAIRTLAWRYANDHEHLRVGLDGGIKHVEQIPSEDSEGED